MFISPDDLCYCGWFSFTLDSLRYTMLLLLCLVILLFSHATQSEQRAAVSDFGSAEGFIFKLLTQVCFAPVL